MMQIVSTISNSSCTLPAGSFAASTSWESHHGATLGGRQRQGRQGSGDGEHRPSRPSSQADGDQ